MRRSERLIAANFNSLLENIARIYRATNDYGLVRDRFCAISVALNRETLWAPRYRPQPLVKPVGRSAGEQLLHKDQLVIDVHWLRCTDAGSSIAPTYSQLFDSARVFDFRVAAAYASENWRSEYRAEEHFALPDSVQWQLVTLRSKAIAERYRTLLVGGHDGKGRRSPQVSAIKKRINTWVASNYRFRGQEAIYLNIWIAREMLGPTVSKRDLARLVGFMSGQPAMDESTMRQKLKSLSAIADPMS